MVVFKIEDVSQADGRLQKVFGLLAGVVLSGVAGAFSSAAISSSLRLVLIKVAWGHESPTWAVMNKKRLHNEK